MEHLPEEKSTEVALGREEAPPGLGVLAGEGGEKMRKKMPA